MGVEQGPHMFPEAQQFIPYLELNLKTSIEQKNEHQLLELLANHFLELEEQYLRPGQGTTPEMKLKFLTSRNVTREKDFDGNPIHTRWAKNPKERSAKPGEISEATHKLASWQEIAQEEKRKGRPLPDKGVIINEICDVVYCLANLTKLDWTNRDEYMLNIQIIANELGMPLRDLLEITVIKYNFRLGQGLSQKDHAIEEKFVSLWLNQKKPDGSRKIHDPSWDEMNNIHDTLDDMVPDLEKRIERLKFLRDRNIRPRR